MKVTDLKINGIRNPAGFSFEKLLCSWKVRDTRAKKQKNARIEVSQTPDFAQIVYQKEGERLSAHGTELLIELKPRQAYYWRVSVEGDNGERAVSEGANFETGKMTEKWEGKWIGTGNDEAFHPVFQKGFCVKKRVASARAYICGLGLYESYLNGRKIGTDYLAPFLNDYLEGYQYQTYDVAELLGQENEWEIFLGKGWYMGAFGLQNQTNLFGERMAAIAELWLIYEDGSTERIVTDESWRYRGSDIEESGIYYGETLNRLLWSGKENPWKRAEVLAPPGALKERYSLPLVVKEQLFPQKVIHTPAGETVLDFGQNHAGYMEFWADFEAGSKIVAECGEILQEGNFYHGNYREARSVFTYISDGRKELVRPHFTYFGYRYLRITGWPGDLGRSDIHSNVVYSDLERTGYIETSHEKINRLYQNCLWSQKSNFIDLPTDCPQRSERLGWTGDAQVFSAAASYNMDTRAFYRKFLMDLRTEQLRADGAIPNYIPSLGDFGATSVWGDAAAFLPWQLYQSYGNLEELAEYYPMMHDWVSYMYQKDEMTGGTRFFKNGFQFGDWLALDGMTEQSFKGSTEDDYIGTVYYYASTAITAKAAARLGKPEDARRFGQLAEEIKAAVLQEYFSPAGRLAVDTQAAYLLALHFGIYRDKQKLIDQFFKRLKRDYYQIKCGFVGAPLLCVTLGENGLTDLAYHFLLNESFPGWLYCVNLGATTIWERWNSLLPDGTCGGMGMNSFNHYAYGSVAEFFYAYIGGIRPDEPGYRKAVIAPCPNGKLRSFCCTYDSVCGKYVSNWEIFENGEFKLHIEIPFGCEAKVILPRFSGAQPGLLESGAYEFSYMPDRDFRRIYNKNTRLCEMAGDGEALEILKTDLPAAYGILMSGDRENGNLTFEELGAMFFMGFSPELVKKAADKIFHLIRW